MKPRHILWDWNGTLLDDTQAALDTLNVMLARRGGRPVAMDFYREHFAFPVRPFYREIGVCLEDEDWDALAREYHDLYERQPRSLAPDALAALGLVRSLGARQSIISALRQDLLAREASARGVAPYMTHVCGTDNLDGASKLRRALDLLAELEREGEREGAVLIGDSLHDKEVADALGVGCVLYSGGSHSAARLRAAAPTADTLEGAVRLAFA